MDNAFQIDYLRSMKQSTAPDPKNGPVYLPGLNGLRAIAALAVVVSHTTLALNGFGLNSSIFGVYDDGNPRGLSLAGDGVTLFFTLSGFLITFLLLKEKELGSIDVKAFYVRRVLRIWPLYYLYFGIVLVILYLFNRNFDAAAVPFYVFLAANVPFIAETAIRMLEHYWSLGVEEQFYLVFPQLAKRSNRSLLRISIVLIVLFLVAKAISWWIRLTTGNTLLLTIFDVCRFHTMLIGVVAAILYYQRHQLFLRITTSVIAQILAWGALILMAVNRFSVPAVAEAEAVSLVAVVLIMGQITRANRFVRLENRICDFVGKISFGIYVIHPLILFLLNKLIGQFETDFWGYYLFLYLLVMAITLTVAWLSFRFYEQPFLRLKKKFTKVESVTTQP